MKTNLNEIIEEYADSIMHSADGKAEALILTGSFSRGEGIFIQNDDAIRLLSDLEFIIIFKSIKAHSIKNIIREIIANIQSEDKEIRVSIGYSTIRHLPNLKPWIYTLELKNFGKVLRGKKDILSQIQGYSYEDIEPIDGFSLLNNRIVEQLIAWQIISNGLPVHYYDIAKGYIQLVNSFLAVNRAYKSLYPEKLSKFIELSPGHQVTRSPALIKKVRQAFDFVKNPNGDIIIEEKALAEWNELRDYYRQMWLEETRIFTKPISFIERVKGWLKVLFDSEKRSLFSFTEIVNSFFKTSPQFLIYQSAAREYFSDNPNVTEVDKIIKQWKVVVK